MALPFNFNVLVSPNDFFLYFGISVDVQHLLGGHSYSIDALLFGLTTMYFRHVMKFTRKYKNRTRNVVVVFMPLLTVSASIGSSGNEN